MPRALWLAETTSKALVSRSPARGHVPEHPGGVLRAERLFHAKPLIIIFPLAQIPAKNLWQQAEKRPATE